MKATYAYWPTLNPTALSIELVNLLSEKSGLYVVLCPTPSYRDHIADVLGALAEDGTPVLTLTDWETLPYDHFSPPADIIAERIHVIQQLQTCTRGFLIVSIQTAMHPMPSPQHLLGRSVSLSVGQVCPRAQFQEQLVALGYTQVFQVALPGDFAVRGNLLDVYPIGAEAPVRGEWMDDTLESLRHFDVDTQRSLSPIDA
ncbi:MAG: transcription-repair coupling factor, partial [Pseudomonadota bacterium]